MIFPSLAIIRGDPAMQCPGRMRDRGDAYRVIRRRDSRAAAHAQGEFVQFGDFYRWRKCASVIRARVVNGGIQSEREMDLSIGADRELRLNTLAQFLRSDLHGGGFQRMEGDEENARAESEHERILAGERSARNRQRVLIAACFPTMAVHAAMRRADFAGGLEQVTQAGASAVKLHRERVGGDTAL